MLSETHTDTLLSAVHDKEARVTTREKVHFKCIFFYSFIGVCRSHITKYTLCIVSIRFLKTYQSTGKFPPSLHTPPHIYPPKAQGDRGIQADGSIVGLTLNPLSCHEAISNHASLTDILQSPFQTDGWDTSC